MAYKVVVMPLAQADLDEYMAFIALDSESAARQWLARAWESIFTLAENPKRFAVIAEAEKFGIELRDVLHYSHRIVYRVDDANQLVEVLRVYHSARKPLGPKDLQ